MDSASFSVGEVSCVKSSAQIFAKNYIMFMLVTQKLTLYTMEVSTSTAKLVKWELSQRTRLELFINIVSIPAVDHFPLPILYCSSEKDDIIYIYFQIFHLNLNSWHNIPTTTNKSMYNFHRHRNNYYVGINY